MPRLSKTQAERQCDAIVRAVDGYFAECRRAGRDRYEAAASLGIPYTTLRRRTMSPESFTLGELQSIANTLNLSLPSLLGERSTT